MKKLCKNISETKDFADKILSLAHKKSLKNEKATVVALSGDLGSGKTAMVKILGEKCGIKGRMPSPTFVIEKRYRVKKGLPWEKLIHIDAYRLDKESEIIRLGWNENISNKKNIIFIAFLFLVFAFLAKGDAQPFGAYYSWVVANIPFGFSLRDATKFFAPLLLFAGILIGSTTQYFDKRYKYFSILIYIFILLLFSESNPNKIIKFLTPESHNFNPSPTLSISITSFLFLIIP